MSQNFPNITGDSYIDTGILALQDRDNATLTWFSGDSAPVNPIENQVWNDTLNKCLKWYHDSDWETIIDYSNEKITTISLASGYQPLNNNLTTYSDVTISEMGFVSNEEIPVSSFFVNKLWSGLKDNIGLAALAYKSKISQNDVADKSVNVSKLSSAVTTTPVFKVGDVIVSFNQGNKSGCVKLSKSKNTVFTVGSTSSNSTYKGDLYKNLFQFIWSNKFVAIYNSNGVKASKGSSWTVDWNANKRLELPHVDMPQDGAPTNKTIISKTMEGIGYTYNEAVNLDLLTQFNSQKTISGKVTIPKNGYYRVILVGGGGGSSDRAPNANGASGYGGAGGYFKGVLLLNKGQVIQYQIGYGGMRGEFFSRNLHFALTSGFDGSYSRITTTNVYINCPGGYGGRSSLTSAGDAGIDQRSNTTGYYPGWTFAPSYTINLPYYTVEAKSTTNSRTSSWYQTYGKGGARVIPEHSYDTGHVGNNGYISIEYVGPKEYNTDDTAKITALDNMYKAVTYFMKY